MLFNKTYLMTYNQVKYKQKQRSIPNEFTKPAILLYKGTLGVRHTFNTTVWLLC